MKNTLPKNGVTALFTSDPICGTYEARKHIHKTQQGRTCRIFSEKRAKELLFKEKVLNQMKPFIHANVKGFNK